MRPNVFQDLFEIQETREFPGIEVRFKRVRAVNYALYHCGLPIVSDLILNRKTLTPSPDLRLSAYIEGYSDIWRTLIRGKDIDASAEYSAGPIPLRLDSLALESVLQPRQARLVIRINEEDLFHEEITILSSDDCPIDIDFAETMACYVQPSAVAVQHVVLDTLNRMSDHGGASPLANGEDGPFECRFDRIVGTLYHTLSQSYRVHYVDPPPYTDRLQLDFFRQKIRTPDRVFPFWPVDPEETPSGSGTCLDLACLMASCIENLRLEPLLIFVHEPRGRLHALAGCWKDASHRTDAIIDSLDRIKEQLERQCLIVLESTGFSDRTTPKPAFPRAVADATDQVREAFAFAVDIAVARREIAPIDQPMSPAAVDVIRTSEFLARQCGETGIETRYLLFGFFLSDAAHNPTLLSVLERAGVSAQAARRAVQGIVKASRPITPSRNSLRPRQTPNLRNVLADAKCMALDTGRKTAGREHLLSALLHSPSKGLHQAFFEIGVDRTKLEQACLDTFSWARTVTHSDYEPAEKGDDKGPPNEEAVPLGNLVQLALAHMERIVLDVPLHEGFHENERIPNTRYRVMDPIGDRWRVLRLIGAGSIGMVFQGLDAKTGDFVAIKTLREEYRDNTAAQACMEREARALAQLAHHPNIVPVLDFECLGDRVFIIMEYVPASWEGAAGGSMRDAMNSHRRPSHAHFLHWGVQICDAMEHLRSAGISHGDIRPENILIDPEGNARLADFQLALAFEREVPAGELAGSYPYMAPERFAAIAAGGAVDPRSDLYSFGVLLVEQTTGALPFRLRRPHYGQGLKSAWERLHTLEPVPDVPPPFTKIAGLCLAKRPAERYAGFDELRCALEGILSRLSAIERRAIAPHPSPAGRRNALRGSQFLTLGRYEDAIRSFDQAISVQATEPLHACGDPGNVSEPTPADLAQTLNGKAFSLLALCRQEEAFGCFESALSIDPHSAVALAGMGCCKTRSGKPESANAFFHRALELDPGIPALWCNYARNQIRGGLRAEARESYGQAIRLLVSRKRGDEALVAAREALAAFPEDLKFRQQFALILRLGEMDEGRLLRSIEAAEALYEDSREDPESAGILAGSYMRLWRLDRAKYAHMLDRSFQTYFSAWQASGRKNTYVGGNAARIARILGKPDLSREIAGEVLVECEEEITRTFKTGAAGSSFWYRATLAEAFLLLGKRGRARTIFHENMMKTNTDRKGYIDSTLAGLEDVFPHLGFFIDPLCFVQMAKPNPAPLCVRVGILGDETPLSDATLQERVRGLPGRIYRELHEACGQRQLDRDMLAVEVVASLSTNTVRSAVRTFMQQPDCLLHVVMDAETDRLLSTNEPCGIPADFRGCLDLADEITLVAGDGPAGAAESLAPDSVLRLSDILVVMRERNARPDAGPIDAALTLAEGRGMPVFLLEPSPPHRSVIYNLEKLVSIDFRRRPPMYEPKPIDTSNVRLTDDLVELQELLARNAHDRWAVKRMEEGWTWGPRRDDVKKQHPDLVSYEDLPSSEKDFDRVMAMETLKAIVALGYKVRKSS